MPRTRAEAIWFRDGFDNAQWFLATLAPNSWPKPLSSTALHQLHVALAIIRDTDPVWTHERKQLMRGQMSRKQSLDAEDVRTLYKAKLTTAQRCRAFLLRQPHPHGNGNGANANNIMSDNTRRLTQLCRAVTKYPEAAAQLEGRPFERSTRAPKKLEAVNVWHGWQV